MRYTVLSHKAITAWAVLIVLVGVGVAVWLLLAYTGGNTDTNRMQLDAIRTAGTIVVGTGGAAALLLAARRQRTAEIALKQKDRDQADVARAHAHEIQVAEQIRLHQERVAAANEADAAARRITDLYAKAADQLGSEKAPVRLAGLYALERLGQEHAEQRQTIVNVLCAYLRMPYTLPGDAPADDASDQAHTKHQERVQEREVRLAVQRVLSEHLRPGSRPDHPIATFWADIDIELPGATLINLYFTRCTMRHASFAEVEFVGDTWLTDAKFTDHAHFQRARFTGQAHFDGTEFTSRTWFDEAKFTGNTSFFGVEFVDIASFDQATLPGNRYVSGDTPEPWSHFLEARFARDVPEEVAGFVPPPDEESNADAATG